MSQNAVVPHPASQPRPYGPLQNTLRLVVGFTLLAVGSVVTMLLCLLALPFRALRIKICNGFGKLVGPALLWLGGVKAVIRNQERLDASYPAIYVSNHTSLVDMFIAMWLTPFGGCGISKKEIGRIPFFGQLYHLSGHLLIDRGNRDKAIAAMRTVSDVVRTHGLGIWIWPEGTRSRDGRLLPLKKGVIHLAIATGLPIVPVIVHDGHKAVAKNSHRLNRMTLFVDVLPPVPTTGWSNDTLEEHKEQLWRTMADALADHQKPLALLEGPETGAEDDQERAAS